MGRLGRLLFLTYALLGSCSRSRYQCIPARVFALIIVRDLYSPLQPLVRKLHSAGILYPQILLLDSGSSAPDALSALDKLSNLGCKIIRIGSQSQRYGPYALWMDKYLPVPASLWEYPFILTDPDLALDGLPKDWLECLFYALNRYRWTSKIALGLRVDDIDCDDKYSIKEWEARLERRFPAKFLQLLVDRDSTLASAKATDTTLALYRPLKYFSTLSVRLEGRYRIRHLPWYQSFFQSVEYRDYQRFKLPSFGHWS